MNDTRREEIASAYLSKLFLADHVLADDLGGRNQKAGRTAFAYLKAVIRANHLSLGPTFLEHTRSTSEVTGIPRECIFDFTLDIANEFAMDWRIVSCLAAASC